MVYNGCPPLVQGWNGFFPSSKSMWNYREQTLYKINLESICPIVEFPYFSISFKHMTVNGHPRIRNLPCILTSPIFDPPIHPLLPFSSPCPCCLSRCLIFHPPQRVKLLKELTLPSSTDLKCSVTYNIISLYRTTPFDLCFPPLF